VGTTQFWRDIASSSDGTKLAALEYEGNLWTSTDSGQSWKLSLTSSPKSWEAIASSSDGAKLAAAVYGGDIYVF